MTSERLLAIFDRMAQNERADHRCGGLCTVASDVLNISGAAIALSSTDRELVSFCSSNNTAQSLLDLEITVREGPTTDAATSEALVDERDLVTPTDQRWTFYRPGAIELGARAVFGFPVRIGAVRLGALGLFRDEPGELSDSQSIDGYLMASVIGRALVALQAGAGYETLSVALQRDAMLDFSVQQAAGMVAVQGAMSVESALVAMRAHAFTLDLPVSSIAASVVTLRLRYDPDTASWDEVA